MKNLGKKKKGFTLIELIIVLAVMAIIALIAIPNFNSVKENSKKKADLRSCETIERLALIVEADKDQDITGVYFWNDTIELSDDGNNKIATYTEIEQELADNLTEVKAPQQKGMSKFKIEFKAGTEIEVTPVS